jgi:hypothetical protein
MRVRISVLGLLPVGPATVFVATFLYQLRLPKFRTKAQDFESPLTPTLSPLDKGGEGREWGDSTRAGIGELWLGGWYNKLWTRDWYHMRLRRPSARSRAAAR